MVVPPGFLLVIDNLVDQDFFCAIFRIIHFLRLTEQVKSFKFFGDATLFYQLKDAGKEEEKQRTGWYYSTLLQTFKR